MSEVQGKLANDRAERQEKDLANFLIMNGIQFIPHKQLTGFGGKEWIVDFYLPEEQMIIEAKLIKGIQDHQGRPRMGANMYFSIYKDLYKLLELKQKFHLTPILYIVIPKVNLLPPTFMSNLSAHGIFYINNPIQILTVIQSRSIEETQTQVLEESESKTISTKIEQKIKLENRLARSSLACKVAWLYSQTGSYDHIKRELNIDHQTIKRSLRKFMQETLKEMPPINELSPEANRI